MLWWKLSLQTASVSHCERSMLSYKYQKPFILFHSRSNFTIYLHHILLPTFSESWVLQSEQRTLAASCNDTGQLLNPRLYTSILCNFWKKLMLKNGRKIQYNICFPFVLSRDGCKVKHTTPALWVIKGWGKWSESCKWVIHLQLFPHRHPPTPPFLLPFFGWRISFFMGGSTHFCMQREISLNLYSALLGIP